MGFTSDPKNGVESYLVVKYKVKKCCECEVESCCLSFWQ